MQSQHTTTHNWRMIINICLLLGVWYVFRVYDVMDYTGVIFGICLIFLSVFIIDALVRTIFRGFKS